MRVCVCVCVCVCVHTVAVQLYIFCHALLFHYLVFHQGDEGTSWYIIYKGSVNVIVHGKVLHYFYF